MSAAAATRLVPSTLAISFHPPLVTYLVWTKPLTGALYALEHGLIVYLLQINLQVLIVFLPLPPLKNIL